uniref:ATP-binding protein n=6 Tax=Rhizobium/Agrobacterium group TaxID=227290 RepID=A0A2Z2PE24_AGRTU|nr:MULTISPECIES: ATP-binding protein [Agrobacterium tumefaciens complex]ASK41604.1 ATP-binding protein [Agrobacterium tumefaciens]ASK47101.1 ATP-binding protein [Agrobacterium radiobacter]
MLGGNKMPSLKSNLVKRIDRLPKPGNAADAMQPLFEAVSNSIHSTQDRFKENVATNGKIVVTLTMARRQAPAKIIVEDNGIGLDSKNYEAFTTTDTDNKIARGGKGVGRLLWLDSFEAISVSSKSQENGRGTRRKFRFVLSRSEQIQDYEESSIDGVAPETGVMVEFSGLRDNGYRAKFPGRPAYVFQHFTSHFLPTFIGSRSPQITVHCGDETRHYPEEINSIIHRRETIENIATVDYGPLTLTLMECDKIASADLQGSHFVHFIAHDRTVHSQKIDGKLGLKYFGPNEDRVFHAVLTGKYLDDNVNQERTKFQFEDAILDRIVNDVCTPHIEKFLAEPLQSLRQDQRTRVKAITESYPSVAFGDVDELQEKLPSGELNDDAIFGHLSRERYRRDQRQAEKIRTVLERLKEPSVDVNTFAGAIEAAGKAIEEAEQKSLTEYIVRRKVVLDFIEILLEKVRDDTRDSSYQREDILHSFICPLRVNTLTNGSRKVVPASSHDLWIIDERLTFAQYFSSDAEFQNLSDAVASEERPDVLIFDHVHGLRQTEDPSRVLLVEFKRPGRTSYASEENPQHQVERYVRRLLEGGKLDVKGRPIKLKDDTVFYCFIVADIVGKLDEWTYSWDRTADGRGRLYQPRSGFKGSIELIAWDTLLSDARERNQAFFDRAGISGKSFFVEAQDAAHQRLRAADDKAAETTLSYEAASV